MILKYDTTELIFLLNILSNIKLRNNNDLRNLILIEFFNKNKFRLAERIERISRNRQQEDIKIKITNSLALAMFQYLIELQINLTPQEEMIFRSVISKLDLVKNTLLKMLIEEENLKILKSGKY